MSRYKFEDVEWQEDQIFDGDNRRFAKRDVDQPKRAPIRSRMGAQFHSHHKVKQHKAY